VSAGHTITTETGPARVQVVVAGVTLADTTHAVLLHETGLPTRYYLPRADVAMEHLVSSPNISMCPFKGDAVYWSARVNGTELANIAWSYPKPLPERADITELLCFFDERVDAITVDGVAITRPETPWSAPVAS
jgi:uncharacterized protein (DUF427 family)